jgi:hypothetical protein
VPPPLLELVLSVPQPASTAVPVSTASSPARYAFIRTPLEDASRHHELLSIVQPGFG